MLSVRQWREYLLRELFYSVAFFGRKGAGTFPFLIVNGCDLLLFLKHCPLGLVPSNPQQHKYLLYFNYRVRVRQSSCFFFRKVNSMPSRSLQSKFGRKYAKVQRNSQLFLKQISCLFYFGLCFKLTYFELLARKGLLNSRLYNRLLQAHIEYQTVNIQECSVFHHASAKLYESLDIEGKNLSDWKSSVF